MAHFFKKKQRKITEVVTKYYLRLNKPSRNGQRLLQFYNSGKILPDLVTLSIPNVNRYY